MYENALGLIGNTPIVKLPRFSPKDGATIYAKLEWYNIGGSVKDRMAKYLIEYAEAAGKLSKDKIILEATSGNTGIALAMIAAVKGYRVKIIMPESVSVERRKIIKAYGAELVLSPAEKGTGGAVELKQKILEEEPDKYVDLDQFSDPANILAHYQTTGPEIWRQMGGKVDTVVVGVGTAGTGVGTAMRLKEYREDIRVIGVMPALGTAIQGLRNVKEYNPTKLFRSEWFDEVIELNSDELGNVKSVARDVARTEGLLVGYSAAAILLVARRVAEQMEKGKNVVAVLPDNGMKYLSTDLYDV